MISALEKNREIAIFLTILMAVEIFYLSSLSGTSAGGGSPWIPRAYHFMIFFLFNFFLMYSLRSKEKMTYSLIVISLIIALLYAASDEIHQLFVPGRDASISDFLTNSLGVFTSMLLYFFIDNKRFKSKKKKKGKN